MKMKPCGAEEPKLHPFAMALHTERFRNSVTPKKVTLDMSDDAVADMKKKTKKNWLNIESLEQRTCC